MKLRFIAALGCFAPAAVGGVVFLATSGAPTSIAPPVVRAAHVAPAPPAGALALARRDGTRVLAVALQRRGGSLRATATVLDASGRPVDRLAVRIAGVPAAGCGPGCYRATLPGRAAGGELRVTTGAGRPAVAFGLPRTWPVPAAGVLRRIEDALRSARSVTYREHLESAPGAAVTTTWHAVAPDRLTYSIAGGSSAVIVGGTRWDRPEGSVRWIASKQERVSVPALPWSSRVRDAVMLDPRAGAVRLALFDPSTPAWYEVTADPRTFRLRSVRMVAPSHFMRDDYAAYGGGAAITPPGSRRPG